MQMTRELEGGIDTMCNVSQGIKEKSLATGIAQGITQGIEQGKLEHTWNFSVMASSLFPMQPKDFALVKLQF